jgi:L-histidine Nalpha-methyltransferase
MSLEPSTLDPTEAQALRDALTGPLPSIPSRFLYDDHGSELFEAITRLPEYYQTRTELAILEARADDIIAEAAPRHLAELGSGAGRKIGLLIEALLRRQGCHSLALLDINATFVATSAETLRARYPGLVVHEVVGRFTEDLDRLGPGGGPDAGRMIVFFGSTLGNFHPEATVPFLRRLAALTGAEDSLLLGLDLVKDPAVLEAAYNDRQGITAAFNRNILRGFNRATGADFDPERFAHRAFYDPENAWIEMRLRATAPQRVHVPILDLTLSFDAGDEIRTEISCKYTRERIDRYAAEAGLRVAGWYTDDQQRFALAMLRSAAP